MSQGFARSNTVGGVDDSGSPRSFAVTPEGHLEVAIHAPSLPFGSIHAERLTPVFQTDAVYGLNSGQVAYGSSGSGSVVVADSSFSLSSGTTVFSQAFLQSRKRIRYRAGQGVVGRFAGFFTSPVANSYQVIGFGHADDGVYFGYQGTSFGILYVQRGVREVRTLTITTASSTTENITITLNGTANTVAVTNSGNIQRTVWEIATATYTGWKAYPSGATIIFIRDAAGTASGTYSITATTAAGTYVQTKAGVASTDSFVAQSSWNGDKLDGTGASGATLDPTKGNVFQIGIQYLGYGTISFDIEVAPSDGNNATFVRVHTLRLPNTLTATSFSNPSFPFSAAVYSAGSTTDLTIKFGSFAGFIEGDVVLHGNRYAYVSSTASAGSSSYYPLITVMNGRYFTSRANQSVIHILSTAFALKHNFPATFALIKNGTLTGNPNFSSYDVGSCALTDTSATAVSFSANSQLIAAFPLGDTGDGSFQFKDDITLQPGEWVSLAVKTNSGTATYANMTLNTREDQ